MAGSPPSGFLDAIQGVARSILDYDELDAASVKVNSRSNDVAQLIIGTDRPYSEVCDS
jgi:hypothetical protein